jgi:hypothetical protein
MSLISKGRPFHKCTSIGGANIHQAGVFLRCWNTLLRGEPKQIGEAGRARFLAENLDESDYYWITELALHRPHLKRSIYRKLHASGVVGSMGKYGTRHFQSLTHLMMLI